LTLLDRVSAALASRGIDHAIIGAAALAAHGVARATLLRIGDSTLRVARAADLILLKLYAGGPQDAWDIDQLLDVDATLVAEVEVGLSSLPEECAVLWRRILGQRSPSR
jgi:hypothetical protein